MDVLRLLNCVYGVGLGISLAFAAERGMAQDVSGLEDGVEVTSGVMDAALVLDRPAAVGVEEPIAEVEISDLAPAVSLRPVVRDTWAVPEARWDDHPRGPAWTQAVLSALRGPGAPLLDVVPRDISAWCPGYEQATPAQRAAFWTGLVSTLAWHESTHRPGAVGGGGRWFGLVQIAPGTAEWRDCDVESGQALLHGPANLRCGIRIMAITVPRDQVVAAGMRGVAADWGPFHSSRKREDMRNWVSSQSYCEAPAQRMRPVMRPIGLAQGGADVVLSSQAFGGIAQSATGPTTRPVMRPTLN